MAMRRNVHIALIAANVAAFLASTPVLAQAPLKCPNGKTADGKCANGAVMRAMRQRAVVFTQGKLSYTGVPTLQGTGPYAGQALTREQQDVRYDVYGSNPNAAAAAKAAAAGGTTSGTFVRLPAGVNPASLHLAAPFTVVPGGIVVH
jgi:hypothetical protein